MFLQDILNSHRSIRFLQTLQREPLREFRNVFLQDILNSHRSIRGAVVRPLFSASVFGARDHEPKLPRPITDCPRNRKETWPSTTLQKTNVEVIEDANENERML